MTNKNQSSFSNHKQMKQTCYGSQNCKCNICGSENQLFKLFEQKQKLEWFGKKKNNIKFRLNRQASSQEMESEKRNLVKRNKKNESSSEGLPKKYIQCNSLYLKNYSNSNTTGLNKKAQKQKYTPLNNLSFQKSPIDFKTSLYNDTFNNRVHSLQKQKAIIPLQRNFNLPFIGKSNYKKDFVQMSNSQRSEIIMPTNKIKTISVDSNHKTRSIQKQQNLSNITNEKYTNKIKQSQNKATINQQSLDKQQERRQYYQQNTPFKRKDHLFRSTSFKNAYDTLYSKSFIEPQQSVGKRMEPNPQFVRRSKFGSMSKVRWTRNKSEAIFKDQTFLSLYV